MRQDENDLQNLIDGLNVDDRPDPAYRQALREKMLDAFDRASRGAGEAPVQRERTFNIMRRRIIQLAVAAAIVVAVTAGILVMTVGKGPSIGFADVQQHVRAAFSMACTMHMTMQDPMGKPQTMTMKMFSKEPGLMRQEFVESSIPGTAGNYTVSDVRKAKSVSFVPKQKMAVIIDFGGFPPELLKDQNKDPLGEFKKMIEGSDTPLGEKTIDGRKTQGFDVVQDGMRMQVWADAKTAVPVQMKMSMPFMNAKITMSDFRFNEPMEDSLFSQEIPKDYKIQNMDMSLKDLSEKDLLDGLKTLAELNNGVFTESVFSVPGYLKVMQNIAKKATQNLEKDKSAKPGDEKKIIANIQSLSKKAMRMLLFAITQQKTGQFQYFGEGVKLGDAGRAILLYRSAGSKAVRIVFGDLSVKEMIQDKPLERLEGK